MSGNFPGGRIEAALQLSGAAQNRAVLESWQRCEERFGLAHDTFRRPEIMPESQTRRLRDRNGRLYHHAHDLVRTLYRKIDASGYAVFLTDNKGVILDSVAAHSLLPSFQTNGLLPGAVWTEEREGTNGIGTCLVEGRAITIHKDEHFLSQHSVLTCTAAPVFSPDGKVCSVLDVSAVREDIKRTDCLRVRGMIADYADALERILFFDERAGDIILHLHPDAQHVGSTRDAMISITPDGVISGATSMARRILNAARQSGDIHDIRDIFEMDVDSLLAKFTDQNHGRTDPHAHSSGSQSDPALAVNIAGGGVLFGSITLPEKLRRQFVGRATPPKLSVPGTRMSKPTVTRATPPATPAPTVELADRDPALRRIFDIGSRLHARDINILMSGETGSGKEYLARHIHDAAIGTSRSFVAINCAALPEGLIENELFGHAGGAFTGAARDGFGGRIREANGGTLFLDEIGDMPLSAQGRLLRVLENRTIEPLGSTKSVPVNFRLICASNVDLTKAVANGTFREDLLYRIKGARLAVPALRDRIDLPDLIARLLHVMGPGIGVDDDVLAMLSAHQWPGNVRELLNVLQYACVFAENGVIGIHHLPDDFTVAEGDAFGNGNDTGTETGYGDDNNDNDGPMTSAQTMERAQGAALRQVLEDHHWHISNTAKALGIGRNTLYRRMARLGIEKTPTARRH
ncbi:sigma-54-dependent Fis family transcriptional regulator [Thalassospira lucentensis]|uniref:sigma-54-dependent Fis family transcriptional regulator n=1 Tax=Thalassospira lucentensis TaxID=168935 RepID=UPI00142E1288|nr:sigma-54-dependent Fis family transcriptional regulator [Thalassospira lucentensis]NIZ03269.1 sigma-54-dependent Fis family transcriptional regulator [Thalassospira lucentensis]